MRRLSPQQHHRLKALGIDVWRLRKPPGASDQLRIRLASGHGPWVLVQRQPWRGEFEALLADITATLGVDQCRFGQWTKSEDAGVGVAELSERGVRYVLSFGPPPMPVEGSSVIEVDAMQTLHDDPTARQALWQQLKRYR